MRSLTVAEVMALKPCSDYSEARIRELWAERKALTIAEIAALEIPLEDRLWCVLAPGVLPDAVLGELHCRIVDEAVEIYERYYPNDPRPRHANEVHRAMLRGEATAAEWSAARAAAWDAARAAGWSAARAAAWDAAWDAGWAAARAAAWDAARAAGWAAAWNAARAAGWAAARAAGWDAAGDATFARYLNWAVEAAESAE